MILPSLTVTAEEFHRATGWKIEPRGACKDVRCIPLPPMPSDALDARALADALGMPLVQDEETGVCALGPEAGGRALATADAPELTLPAFGGGELSLSSLRGQKVLLLAWASW